MRLLIPQKDLTTALALARIVKSDSGDLAIRVEGKSISFFSYDKRRFVVSRVNANGDSVPLGDHYISLDRIQILESGLESVSLSMSGNSMTITSDGGGQSRTAVLKSRAPGSRRPPIPSIPADVKLEHSIKSSELDWILRQLSCSALVKETKTDEDMRINQVHFFGDAKCSTSSTGYHVTAVRASNIDLDLSIVSSDIPAIRAFCTKCHGDVIVVSSNDKHIFFSDVRTNSFLALSRISSKRPALSLPDHDGFKNAFVADGQIVTQNAEWASMAIEGTQRVTFSVSRFADGSGEVKLIHGQELSKFPVRFLSGEGFSADFPIRYISSVLSYIDGQVLFRFSHKDVETLLCISGYPDRNDGLSSSHYMQCMRSR